MSIEPIAIVGTSCRLPGNSNSPGALWELLGNGGDAWSPVPRDRFNEFAFYHPSAKDPNGTSNHQGGHFISGDVRDFDNAFFHISPQQAAAMDPQQRILLELAYEAFEDAGWTREAYTGSRMAVFAAIFSTDYERNLGKDVLDLPVYQSVGTGPAILANRISHAFDLRGPSVTLDTGCSGGLVALQQACQALWDGSSNSALVGAANLQLMPDHYVGMSNQQMVSSTGRCYPFDVRGNGYGRGEGFVAVALKRLSTALEDGDVVRSVVLNIGVNQDGYTALGITHPSRAAQADLIRETYARIGLDPQHVPYVEAHGTGTVAGDGEELEAIAEVFTGPERSWPLYVGSNKGSVGHTECTSGLVSLLKAISMLDKGVIPPVAGFAAPKPGLPVRNIKIPIESVPWPETEEMNQIVSINNFGYGGTNAHAIVGRGPRTQEVSGNSDSKTGCALFVFSANSHSSLKSYIGSFIQWVDELGDAPLVDVSYTLCHRRSALSFRFSCVADDSAALQDALRRGLSHLSRRPCPSERRIVYLFSGQGAQWAGMGRELLIGRNPSLIFRDSIRASRDILNELGAAWDLEVELLREDDGGCRINEAEIAQPATTAVQIALVMLLQSQNIQPWAVVGHSSGEIAAAFAAGRISHRMALRIAFHRGFVAADCRKNGLPTGAMLSVGLGAQEMDPYLKDLTSGQVGIACVNSPTSVTVSGDADAISEVMARVAGRDDGAFCRKLVVDTAYHSHHMQAVAQGYLSRLCDAVVDTNVSSPTEGGPCPGGGSVRFVSTVSGQEWTEDFPASYWMRNLVSTVRFSHAMETVTRDLDAHQGNMAVFLEIGPHAALASPVRQCLAAAGVPKLGYDYASMLRRGVDAIVSTHRARGRLFELGINFSSSAAGAIAPDSRTGAFRQGLPSYSWDRSNKHWCESRLSREHRFRSEPYHDLLGVRMTGLTSLEPHWRHLVGMTTLPWLADHVIDGVVVFPGAGYICMVIEALMQLARQHDPCQTLEAIRFRGIAMVRALVIPDATSRVELQLSFRRLKGRSSLEYFFSIAALLEQEWHEYCSGSVEGIMVPEQEDTGFTTRFRAAREESHHGHVLLPEHLYAGMEANGNAYGPAFRGLQSLQMSKDALEAVATVRVAEIADFMPEKHQAPHVLHPTTLDSMFHVGIPMIRQQHGDGSVMPLHIGELLISAKALALSEPGSQLEVSAQLVSSRDLTTIIDMNVSSHALPVLRASAIESRSLPRYARGVGSWTVQGHGMCHELVWRSDLDFLRSGDLPTRATLADLLRCICFKKANLLIAQLGKGRENLQSDILTAISVYGGTVASFDFIDSTVEHAKENRQSVIGFPIQHRSLDAEESHEAQDAYDIVVLSDLESLDRASALMSEHGRVIVLSDSGIEDVGWTHVKEKKLIYDMQLSLRDAVSDDLILVARHNQTRMLNKSRRICLLTHSIGSTLPLWVVLLLQRLEDAGFNVACESLSQHEMKQDANADDACVVVVDDLPHPILSDRAFFDAAIKLLRQQGQILWLSPDCPSPMHQITGVARTAQSENDDLHLTTIHTAPNMMESPRLFEVALGWLHRHAGAKSDSAHGEREYRLGKDGEVLIPRLFPSERLNHAVSALQNAMEPAMFTEDETHRFSDAAKSVFLDPSGKRNSRKIAIFSEADFPENLGDDAVELETEAFVLRKARDPAILPLGEYTGVISRVGKAVNDLAPGEAVVALCLEGIVGANRPQFPRAHVGRRPSGMAPTVAAALLHPVLAACHALSHLDPLSKGTSHLLIHGVLTDVGRAMVVVARTMGVTVWATATDSIQGVQIVKELNLEPLRILVSRPSLLVSRLDDDGPLDAILHASEDAVPPLAWSRLKHGGAVIVLDSSLASIAEVPSNTTVHSDDVTGVLRTNPNLAAGLVALAAEALRQNVPCDPELPIYNVAQVAEAALLLKPGRRAVIQALPSSLIRSFRRPYSDDGWTAGDASYVIAGGMGDLGRRLMLLMARRGAMHLVTLSRRPIDAHFFRSVQAQLETARPGCRLYCLLCDVTSECSVQSAADSLARSGIPPVRGVIQSAVTLQDRTLETMTFDDFLKATLAKVDGTLALEKAFKSPALRFFLMLSSAVSITGASGQANYNAGNAVQEAMAHDRKPGFFTVNIGWIEDAIHTSNDKTKLQGLWRTGLRPITSHELSQCFDYVLEAASRHLSMCQAIIGFDAASLSQTSARNSNVQAAMFSHVQSSLASVRAISSMPGSLNLVDIMQNGDRKAAVDYISEAIAVRITSFISEDASSLNQRNGSILDTGIDSLVAIELRNWINREFDAPLQSSEILTDQSIRRLAEKVMSRSSLVTDGALAADSLNILNEQGPVEKRPSMQESPSGPALGDTRPPNIPAMQHNLPLPDLTKILQAFEDSRRAIDTPDQIRITAAAVRAFLEGPGPTIYREVKEAEPAIIADTYDHQVYLERREPLPEQGTFVMIHPVRAPIHSQADRAAILTLAAVDFAKRLAKGEAMQDKLLDQPLLSEGRKWLFSAGRRPHLGEDSMERHALDNTVAVLRRGHVFQLKFPGDEMPLNLAALRSAYEQIILAASRDVRPSICTLTADERDSWALLRQDLERRPGNAATLLCIERALFVLCLDEESPTSSGERYTQFIMNGAHQPFSNRWLDKTCQLAVTDNGMSAEVYEHSKLDGLDARALHAHLVQAILAHPADSMTSSASVPGYPVEEFFWEPGTDALERIHQVRAQCRLYGPLDHQILDVAGLGLQCLRGRRSPPNATAHLTVLLALRLLDGYIRPAWEKVSLGHFAHGRVEWVQTVTLASRAFIEAAASGGTEANSKSHTRALFNQATLQHSRTLLAAGRGFGSVGLLYALRGAAREVQGDDMPELFKVPAWAATVRGGPGQDVRLGFMRMQPDDETDGSDDLQSTSRDGNEYSHVDEAGFLVKGERGVYVHCNVSETRARFAITGRPAYVAELRDAISHASDIILSLVGDLSHGNADGVGSKDQ